MLMKTLELRFDTGSTSNEKPVAVDGDRALQRALELGFRWVHIDWAGIFEVDLPVEDDVMFLAMGYAELDAFCCSGTKHHLFLGDGLLDVSAERDNNTVKITFCHAPHLDRRLSDRKSVTIPLSDYQHAWWSLMSDLLVQLRLNG
jgi:hypothetical protein